FVRVARSTVASNSDKITALDSNACIGNVLDVLLDSGVLLTTNNDRTAVHDGIEALNDRGRNADNKLLLILVDICIGTVRIVNNFRDSLVGLNDALDRSPLQVAVLIRDQHRIRSTFLDLNFVRVARSTVASNSDKITALVSNARIGNILDVLLDRRKFIAIDDDRPTIDDSLKILHNRCRNIILKSLVLLVRVRINTVLVRNE